MSLNREISTDEYLGTFKQSTEGEKVERVLCLADRLYRDEEISYEQWAACGILRNLWFMEMPPSEGVSSYGQSVRASEPSGKANRVGRRHTGYTITARGEVVWAGGRRRTSNRHDLEDALVAACGVIDSNGQRQVNIEHVHCLIDACTATENMPTLTGLSQDLSDRYGAKSKQAPSYAWGVLETLIKDLTLYFRNSRKFTQT